MQLTKRVGNEALKHATKPTRRKFSTTRVSNADFTHAVIGGGAVGLAIARQLAARPGTSTILIERHGSVGTETSSRNSEVIHAGLYYGHDSLKTSLCLKGKHMLYDLAQKHSIPHRNTKKWIIAQDDQQMGELEKVHKFASSIGVPTHFLSRNEISTREPDVKADAGVLESTSTGIIDSHALMSYLEAAFLDRGGEEILHTSVTALEKLPSGEYQITTCPTASPNTSLESSPQGSTSSAPSAQDQDSYTFTSSTLINSAGLSAIPTSNLLLPASRHLTPYYAKGTYFSYSSSSPRPSTLLYPAPIPGLGGLGTHLTLDMASRVRFGPDVEWTTDPSDLKPNPSQLSKAIEVIKTYLPGIDEKSIDLDYVGIRPKLSADASGTAGPTFRDFYIKHEEGYGGFVNLLGIESPGLTSCLSIAEYVEGLLYGSGGGDQGKDGRASGGDGVGEGKDGKEGEGQGEEAFKGKGPHFGFHH